MFEVRFTRAYTKKLFKESDHLLNSYKAINRGMTALKIRKTIDEDENLVKETSSVNTINIYVQDECEQEKESSKENGNLSDNCDEEDEIPLSKLKCIQEKEKVRKKRKSTTEAIHCEECNKIFKNSLDFGLHSITHSNDKKYHCYICKYATPLMYSFETHIRAHEGKTKYKCEVCNKPFTSSTQAVEHKYFHTGERPFQCEICGKHFMCSGFLSTHQQLQHSEIITGKPLVKYDCKQCKKHYKSASGLNRHKITKHNDSGVDLSALCDICGKRLSNMEGLKFHKRIHSGYKPYSCSFCKKSFTHREQLKMHERVHTGQKPFICKFCGKGFTQRSPLRIHERTHTGERPYTCSLCNKGFISKGVMDTHMKKCRGQ